MNYQKKKHPLGYYIVDPLPSEKELSLYYQTYYHQSFAADYSEAELAVKRTECQMMLYALQKSTTDHSSQSQTLLELGCGEGFLMKEALQWDWKIQGVDFDDQGLKKHHPELAEHLFVGDLYDFIQQRSPEAPPFQFCVLKNVLEHVRDPIALLEQLKKLILPEGRLLITAPNDYSPLQLKLLELGLIEREHWWAPPDHLSYFNSHSLKQLFSHTGYQLHDLFASFPIDFFLMHPGSNYYKNPTNGPLAHQARIQLELLMAEAGLPALHQFAQALAGVNMGRNLMAIVSPVNIN